MSGIRVSWLPTDCTEKEIKIHFSKRENGGGQIQSIYYPMFNDDAVVLFENRDMADNVVSVTEHVIKGRSVGVTKLPAIQAFPILEARLDPTVAALLQNEDKLREEIQYYFYNDNVEFLKDNEDIIVGIRGNWYLLEWTWAHIDNFIKYRYGNQMDEHRIKHARTKSQRHDDDDEMEIDEPIISLPSGASKKSTKTLQTEVTRQKGSPEPTKQKGSPEPTRRKGSPEPTRRKRSPEPTVRKRSPDPTIRKKSPEPTIRKKGATKHQDEDEARARALDTSDDDEPLADTDIVIKGDKDEVCTLDFVVGSLTVSIFIGWITKAETDAIVNAAMGSLNHAGGVAYAIAKAASPEMQRQCDDYVIKNGSLRDGEVMHTCAGGDISNQVKYVIHAVGPIWMSGLEERCCTVLTRTFLNCLKYANDLLKINTITMPLISSGIFGMPLELCVQSFLYAIVLFGEECDTVSLREVHLVNNNPDNTALTVLQLRKLISQGADKLITDAKLLLRSESTITSHTRSHHVEPRTSLLDKDDVTTTRHTSSTMSEYSTGSPLVRVTGQKLSSFSSSLRKNVDAGERSRSSWSYLSTEEASGFTSLPVTSSYPSTSPGRQSTGSPRSGGSPSTGPPTKSYLYSTEGAAGLGLSSASHSTYRTPSHKHTSTERSSGYNTHSSIGARASGSPSAASSTNRSTFSQPRTTGRPLPDPPKDSSKRY